jgi:uncharacterized membrane protein YgaE (UPF0421/DUF939 family)
MLKNWINTSGHTTAIIYTIRCVLGFLIGYFLYKRFLHEELFWTLLSIVLVISPEEKDSKRLSVERFKSNLIGSGVGLICYLIHPPNALMMVIGIVVTVIFCHLFKMLNMARVAVVALIIILSWHGSTSLEYAPVLRFITVALGCLLGLAIVVSTSWIIKKLKILHD